MAPTPKPTFDLPEWADEAETVEYDGKLRDIYWVRVFSCEEGTSTNSMHSKLRTPNPRAM